MSHGSTARATPDEMAINTAAVVERLPASRSPGTAPPRIVPRHQIKAANTIAMRSAPVSCPPVREPVQVVGFGAPGGTARRFKDNAATETMAPMVTTTARRLRVGCS